MLTIVGACAVTFVMMMRASEPRHGGFIVAFACGCAMSSTYGFLAGAWPFVPVLVASRLTPRSSLRGPTGLCLQTALEIGVD
jgi:hypothetical protein